MANPKGQRCIAFLLFISAAGAFIAVGHRCPWNTHYARNIIKPSSSEPLYSPKGCCCNDAEDVAVFVAAAKIRRSLLELNQLLPNGIQAAWSAQGTIRNILSTFLELL